MGADDLFNKFKKEITEEIRQEFEQSAQQERERYRREVDAEAMREKEAYRRKIEEEVADKATNEARVAKLNANLEKARAKEIAISAQENWREDLETRQRHVIKIGTNGHEEVYQKFKSSPDINEFYTTVAKEIIRRADPENEIIKACIQQQLPHYELNNAVYSEDPIFSAILNQIEKSEYYQDLKDAITICKKQCLLRRCEGFRWVVLHPLYTSASNDMRGAIEKELIRFFDRQFTSQVSHLMGKVTNTGGEVLSIGGDHLLGQEQGIEFSYRDPRLVKHNEECWERIVVGKYP